MINNLPGSNPAAAKAAKLKRELEARKAARDYERHCRSCGMSLAEANLLAPKLVQQGQALRMADERKRRQANVRAQKDAMDRRFGRQRTGP